MAELQKSVVKKALSTLSWIALEDHLSALTLGEVANELLELIWKSEALIIKRSAPALEAKRDSFVHSLGEFFAKSATAEDIGRLQQILGDLGVIEEGYRSILALLSQSTGGALSVEQRVAAAFGRAAFAFEVIEREFQRLLASTPEFVLQSAQIARGDGFTASTDDLLAGLVVCLASTLSMEGHNNRWFKAEKLILPNVGETCVDDMARAATVELLANSWGSWQRAELMVRFLGAPMRQIVESGTVEWLGATYTEVVAIGPPTEMALHDHVANERLADHALQIHQEMSLETSVEKKVAGIDGSVAVAPGCYVSAEEVHAEVLLSQWFGFDIQDDLQEFAGLRLSEWVRGYAALKALSGTLRRGGLFPRMQHSELHDLLARLGLTLGKAATFIDLISFRKTSRDLFDNPLISMEDGSLTICVPALLHASVARIVVSAIANLQLPIDRKGKSFERSMRALFDDQHISTFAFSSTRDGQQFEYDLVVHWVNLLFVFECKNRTLSGHNHRAAYYFDVEMQSAVSQVKRLSHALEQYPDILLDRCGIAVADVTVVPCVLNSLPYSREGKVDGVYITDQSALRRFFEQRHVHLIRPHQIDGGKTILHRTAIHRHWKGEQPSPADLIAALEDPYATKVVRGHTLEKCYEVPIDSTKILRLRDYGRSATSLESVLRVSGLDVTGVRREMKMVTRSISKAKRRSQVAAARQAQKEVNATEKAWRNARRLDPKP
jgi:hypothetical protein